jgi:hypothetical protein
MAYDAARGEVVMFGGRNFSGPYGETWTWDGTDWTQQLAGSIKLTLRSGGPGTVVQVLGWGFAAHEIVELSFPDSTHGRAFLTRMRSDSSGTFITQVTIPLTATPGQQRVKPKGVASGEIAKQGFTVT